MCSPTYFFLLKDALHIWQVCFGWGLSSVLFMTPYVFKGFFAEFTGFNRITRLPVSQHVASVLECFITAGFGTFK